MHESIYRPGWPDDPLPPRDHGVPVFDLPEWQHRAKTFVELKDLFDMWDKTCKLYDQGKIGLYELENMKDCIFKQMENLRELNQMIAGAFVNEAI